MFVIFVIILTAFVCLFLIPSTIQTIKENNKRKKENIDKYSNPDYDPLQDIPLDEVLRKGNTESKIENNEKINYEIE